jgi:acyl transferase domain-containing protein
MMRERSAYRTTGTVDRTSPQRSVINITSELDDHSNRIKELLRADLIMLEEENAILKAKCKKVGELEEKVEMILKQNAQLLSENERLSKLLHQKKQEYEILKDKFEVQSSQKLEYAKEFEYERKKLLGELDQMESELKEVEHLKNAQLNELKSQYQLELQTFKRQNTSSQDVYEQEIRKLREHLDRKDYELSDTVNRLKRFSSEAEYDILRLKEEKEKLRNELLYVETDKKKELDAIRAKLETNYLEEVESVKKNHLASLEGFELENKKLKDLLDSKTLELDQITARLSKQKGSHEESLILARRECELLRGKLVESERLGES